MTRIYSTLGRQILVVLKRGKPMSITTIFDNCSSGSREQIKDQIEVLVAEGKIERIRGSERYRYIDPEKTLSSTVRRFTEGVKQRVGKSPEIV